MQIASDTPGNLILKDNNFSGLILGFVFVVLPIVIIPLAFTSSGNNKLIILGVLVLLILVGLFFIISSYFSTITFDKSNRKILFVRKNIFGKKNSEYNFADVNQVEMREGYTSNQKGGRSVHFQIFLILKTGQQVPLDHMQQRQMGFSMSGLSMGGGTGSEREIGAKVAGLLNVQFVEPGTADVGKIIGNVVSAIEGHSENSPKN